MNEGRFEESIAGLEQALASNRANRDAVTGLGWDYFGLGQFEKSLEYFDKANRISPHDPDLAGSYEGKSYVYFGLKQYDQAIEWARRAVVIDPFYSSDLAVPLALAGHEAEAREWLQRFLELPSTAQLRTISAWKAHNAVLYPNPDPRLLDYLDRYYEGLRKAGMPEE
jgi:tetratricopeptide (TPR) repeat protein